MADATFILEAFTMRRAALFIAILVSMTATKHCIAQWGWPPPGYSTTGIRCSDGYRYRGLCQVWRDRKAARCQNGNSGQPAPVPVLTGKEGGERPSEPTPETLPPPRH